MKTFILVIFCINIVAFDNTEWNNIIYFSNNKPEIISPEFYLSRKKQFTSVIELNATLSLLNSKKYGNSTACNYPLRYTFLKSQYFNIPTYNLENCKELKEFTDNFKNNELYLAYSSEYISVPSSAFGHIMLVFKNKDVPFEIAKTIHFAAVTNKEDGFFTYNYKGLTGGYKGYYVLNYFFKKLYEYNTKEQRNIYLYKLNFSDEQTKKIIYSLYELRKATFKYYFFNKNCASYTTKLLNIPKNKLYKQKNFYLPIDTLQQYKKNIIDKKVFLSLIYKIEYLYNTLSTNDKKNLKKLFDIIQQLMTI
ncbi:DUF4105 domain-containing protein [Sulfurimonas hydrogeniphila]|uniref:Lnb N-terminal periplasmic domain-containing protein n=1 Tax=Sulfurimonas hydrogeniphila TaxID=2509341 RepID=UPI00165F6FB1|nr:DUF4105 domain-containing protein [Sulfurimonas hydrogeniphila]